MTLRIRFRWVWWILLAGIIGVVIYFLTHKKELLKFVVPEITKITLVEADIHSDTAFLKIHAIAQNNAPYRISVDSILCELSLDGTRLLSENQYIGLSQAPKEADTISFRVKVPISRTQQKIQSLQKQDTTGISLRATIIYSTRKLNFTKNKTIDVPIPPRLRIVKTVKRSVQPLKKDLKADLYLEIVNEGKNIDLKIRDLSYTLAIGKDLSTRGKYGKDIAIRPRSAEVLKFPLDFRMNRPVSTILKVWTDTDRVPYRLRLDGKLDAGKLKGVPFIIRGSGTLEIVKEEKKRAEKKRAREKKKQEKEQEKER
jgi:LEA14-like dessication related protein